VLRGAFGPKGEKLKTGWRRLHHEELHNFYASPNIIRVMNSRKMRWAGNVVRMGVMRNGRKILIGKPKEKRPLGRHRRKWKGNIGIDVGEIG